MIAKSKATRWLLPGILLAAITSVLLAASTTAAAQTAAATTPRCTTAGLEVWLGVGDGGSQLGSITYPMEFTNISGRTCHLNGFPGVSAEVAGHQVGSAALRDHSAPDQTVTLGAGATTHTVLQITDTSSFPASSCKPVTADGLTVHPPGASTAAQIPLRFQACSATGPPFLSVQSVQPRVGIPGHP